MSCVVRFIFAAFRVARVSPRKFHGAGNEKARRRRSATGPSRGKRLRYIRSPKAKVRPGRGIFITSFIRLDLLSSIVEYQSRACKAHARNSLPGNCRKGKILGGSTFRLFHRLTRRKVVRSGGATSSCR